MMIFDSKHFSKTVNFFNVLPFSLLFSILLINKTVENDSLMCWVLSVCSCYSPTPSPYSNHILTSSLFSVGLCPKSLTSVDCII